MSNIDVLLNLTFPPFWLQVIFASIKKGMRMVYPSILDFGARFQETRRARIHH